MRSGIAAMMLAACGAAPAHAAKDSHFCITLRSLLDAAVERPAAFASLGPRAPAHIAAALGYGNCRIEPGLWSRRLTCRLAGSRVPQAERISRCLPEAISMAEPDNSPLARFRLGLLSLSVEQRGGQAALTLFALPVHRR